MERISITVRPSLSDQEGLLRVKDAMQQVIDWLRLYEEADQAMPSPEESFEWRLESASANSPFTVVARAQPLHLNVDVDKRVRYVEAEVATGVRNLIQRNEIAPWMSASAIKVVRDVFLRTQNGIGTTEILYASNQTLAIDRIQADAGMRAVEGITAINVETAVPQRTAWGEIQGVMVAAGRYRNKPAIQLKTEQYAFVWCRLPQSLIEKFGGTHKLTEVWDGKTIGVEGQLIYATGGKLSWIEATEIREIKAAPRIDLASVLDPGFTAGLDPAEYVRQLWDGSLAS